MKVATVQMVSGMQVQGNLERARDLLEQAAAAGAEFQRPASAVFADFEPKARLFQPRQHPHA